MKVAGARVAFFTYYETGGNYAVLHFAASAQLNDAVERS